MAGKHEKQEDEDKHEGNGPDPEQPIPHDDPGGKHEKDDKE
ncbi:MAG: hypothetical protein ACRDRY_08285 [Pseudonocardiaceae bacterium]